METLDSNLPREDNYFGTSEVVNYLLEVAKWGKFLSIMGYIAIGLMVVLGVGVMTIGSTSAIIPGMGAGMGAFAIIYIVIAAFYFFPVYYLHQFSLKIKEGLTSYHPQDVTDGFRNLKSLFKFMGIFTIVILSLYVVVIVGAVAVGLLAR